MQILYSLTILYMYDTSYIKQCFIVICCLYTGRKTCYERSKIQREKEILHIRSE